ncbi:Uncharacterised protein [Bordetella pertussis]|nr:Uncharacterised protein [Bordetella pertussis]
MPLASRRRRRREVSGSLATKASRRSGPSALETERTRAQRRAAAGMGL